MILMIDNYDSFTMNLVHLLAQSAEKLKHSFDCRVVRNDEISLEEINVLKPSSIVISPGPCTPNEAGVSCAVIEHFSGKIPILGVCLGHQSLGQVFGGKIIRLAPPVHGKVTSVFHNGTGIFSGLPSPFRAARYHSLAVERSSLPAELEVNAWTEDGVIMGLRHRHFPNTIGVQFHPESIGSEWGIEMMVNFLTAERLPVSEIGRAESF